MNIDLIPNGAIKRVHVSQNDVGRTLTFELFNNSTSYTVPSGATVKIQGTKPSGFGFSETCSVSGNVVTVDTTETMTDEYGYIETELSISYSGNVIGTSNFVLAVERNPHPDTTTDGSMETIIPELTLLVNEVKGYAEEIEGTYHAYGSPWVASTVAQMTDTDKIYVYTGSETGYTSGNWYYYNGTSWVSGGVYNSVAVQTDTTLSVSGMSADAEATGEAIDDIKDGLLKWQRLDIQKEAGLTRLTDLSLQTTYYYGTTLQKAVKKGERYKVTCGKRNVNYSAMYYAKNGAFVNGTNRDEDLRDELITVPSGVDTLILNGAYAYQPSIMGLVTDVDDTVLDLVNSSYGEQVYEEITPTINDGYKSYKQDLDRTVEITHTSDQGYHYVELDVQPYESYKVTCQAVASSKVYQLLDETNYEMISSTASLNDTQIDIPSNAYKLLISYYGDITIKKQKYRIANDVTEINQDITQYNIASGTYNDNSVEGLINSRTKYRYVWHDNFYRDDDTTGLGTNGDSINPMTYSYAGSQLGISNHCAYNTGATKGFAYSNMNVSDCVLEFQADLTNETYTTRGCGVIGRYTDGNNYLYCFQRREYIRFGKCVSGTITELGNVYIISPTLAPKKVGFQMIGNALSVMINGVIFKTVYDNFNSTATSHGIGFDNSSLGKILNFGVKHEIKWQTMIDAMDSGVLPFNIKTENYGQSYNFEIENSIVNGSETALRFENRKEDNYKRSEIAIDGGCKMLDEQVFNFDMMLASEYSVTETVSEIIMQFHDYPDDGDWTAPALQPSFSIFLRDGDYYIHTQWSEDKKSIEDGTYSQLSANLGSYLNDISNWVNWKIHVKWAYNEFFEPILEVFKDGVLVFESKKPNVINASNCPYFKVGVYTFNYVENPSACVSTKRVMYVDNVLGWY